MNRKLIAIFRGIRPDEAVATARAAISAGIAMIEVPLNSPQPLASIRAMQDELAGRAGFGAGTVLSTEDVAAVASAGGDFVVSPNCDTAVIAATKTAGLGSYPGVFTPTECFAALGAGADALKIFPAELVGPKGIRALKAVLPEGPDIYAVGGAEPANFEEWAAAGVDGFGLGSFLYKPGRSPQEVGRRAAECVAAYDRHFT